MKRILSIGSLVVLLLISVEISSQVRKDTIPLVVEGVRTGQDTLLIHRLDEVSVVASVKKRRKYYRHTRKYWRTVRNIRTVYPYAQMANKKIMEIDVKLKSIPTKRGKRKLIRAEYKSMMKDYREPLMKLKISQGRLLMKLIDRETGTTSYEHLKELKGSFTAFFWQSVAVLFGSSLKSEYDPVEKDWMVEEILQRMERGELPPPHRLN